MNTMRASEIFNDAGLMIVVIESVEFLHCNTNTICQMYGKIVPVAVVVCGPDSSYAIDMEAKPASLDQLKQDIPGLDAVISPINPASQIY